MLIVPSGSSACARKVAVSFARTLAGPVRVTLGAWLPSVTVPVKSSSSGMLAPTVQPGASPVREQTLSTTTR